jgi:hypothetical protein
VDFPQPSEPSKVMNGRRGMRAILKQIAALVESRAVGPRAEKDCAAKGNRAIGVR